MLWDEAQGAANIASVVLLAMDKVSDVVELTGGVIVIATAKDDQSYRCIAIG